MSISMTGNPGCDSLGHLFTSTPAGRRCITCGYVEATAEADQAAPAADGE